MRNALFFVLGFFYATISDKVHTQENIAIVMCLFTFAFIIIEAIIKNFKRK